MMRQYFIGMAVLSLAIFSCSKKDDAPDDKPADKPAAKAQFDNSNYGVYKGVFVGSSGIIVVNINNDNTVSATLKVDGVTYDFTTTQTVQQNQTVTVNFVSGNNAFTFSVSANGADPIITNLFINGHPNAAILVVKELSTAIVKCFEGSFGGGDTGTFNAVIYNSKIKGLVRSTTYATTSVADGTAANNQITATAGTVTTGATFTGTVSGDNASGTWTNVSANKSGSWSGTRTY